jgi:hypothetical protein
MNKRNRMGTQLGRRKNRDEIEQQWAEEGAQQQEDVPSNHGQIVRESPPSAPQNVRAPQPHRDAAGNETPSFQRVGNPAAPQHGPAQTLPQPSAPPHQIGGPPPNQGARFPVGHADPRLTPQSQPRPPVYRITASTTQPGGVQAVDPQQGMQSMADRAAQQGGVFRVGGQPVQSVRGAGMAASVQSVPGHLSPAQATQLLAQQRGMGVGMPQSQFQGGNAGVSAGAGAQVAPEAVRPPAGTAEVLQNSSIATIAKADDATTRRELEAAGFGEDRMPRAATPTTLGRRRTAEELGPAPRLDVSVILSAFARPRLLARQIQALRESRVLPAYVVVLTSPGVPGVAEILSDGTPWGTQNGQGPLAANLYALPVTPWERFHVAMRMPTKYVAILDDDCIPGPGWLEACVRASDFGLEAVIAAAGRRLTPNGESDGYRGPARDAQGNLVAEDLDEPTHGAIVDVGELGWFFPTQWAAAIAQTVEIGEPPYGWQIQVSAIPQDDEEPVPTIVLPYAAGQWGAIEPAQSDGLRNQPDMPSIRSRVFSHFREQGWRLCCDEGYLEYTAIPIPTELQKPKLPPGAYFSEDLDRYVEHGDPEWSQAAYERKTGETWSDPTAGDQDVEGEDEAETELTSSPQDDTSGVNLGSGEGESGDAEAVVGEG